MIMENRYLQEEHTRVVMKGVVDDSPASEPCNDVDDQPIDQTNGTTTGDDIAEDKVDNEDEGAPDEGALASDLAWHNLLTGMSALRILELIPVQKESNRRSRKMSTKPGNRFVHYVPPPLRHIGCMWLDHGDEDQRCRESASWTMGANLNYSRLYCEKHALIILKRRQVNYQKAKRRSKHPELSSA